MLSEKSAIRVSLGGWGLEKPPGVCRTKNIEDSVKYRKYGNDFYKIKMPDEKCHEKVWRFYTQSIALAPNGSSELALGYGNRSALLFHLQKYEDCVKDCNKAIDITCCDFLKCKLMCRRAECLALLNKNSAKSACSEALEMLSQIRIDQDLKMKLSDKLCNIINTLKISNASQQINRAIDLSELTNLEYQKEAPCASTSIKINYSEQWGRHITATQDIRPGDVVAIEDNFCTLLSQAGMYLFCSNCTQPAWSSIPCRYCIFDVYCSEKCMCEAWNKFHKYECPIYPYIWDIDESINNGHMAIRLLLIMIDSAGGIGALKKTVEEVENCKDPRTKGFSSDGVFNSNDAASMYSQMYADDDSVYFPRIHEATMHVHLLATKTDLFGQKMNLEAWDMMKNDDIIFVAALLARIHSVLERHSFTLTRKFEKETVDYGISVGAFKSFFNHSCSPNTELIAVKNNKTLIYAKHPIKKGEQLFVSYRGVHYLNNSKEQRYKDLNRMFDFECSCLACKENWSNICVPNSTCIFETTPDLKEEMMPISLEETFDYSLESAKKIKLILKSLSEKMTVHCSDYCSYELLLAEMYIKYFGNWIFDMSHKCT